MSKSGNGTLSLFRKVAIIGGALIVVGTIIATIIMVSPTTTAMAQHGAKNSDDIAGLDDVLQNHIADDEHHINVPALEMELAHIKASLLEIKADLKQILQERSTQP